MVVGCPIRQIDAAGLAAASAGCNSSLRRRAGRVVGEAHAQSEVRDAERPRSGAGRQARPGGALPDQVRLLLPLQQSAGNRAVSGLVQRWRDRPEDSGFAPVQREGAEEEEPLQARFATAQRQRSEDEELQIKQAVSQPTRLRAGFGRAVLQREVTGQTQIDWKPTPPASPATADAKRHSARSRR